MSGFDYGEKRPDGQHERHPMLPEEARKEFVRPVRTSYRHTRCGSTTSMGRGLAETYAVRPGYYGSTFCSRCRDYFPVGAEGEFEWVEADGSIGPRVGT